MKTTCFSIVLLASVIGISAQAQKMDPQWLKQQLIFVNERANWKLLSKATDLDFYYDADNIQRPGANSLIVAVKTVYRSQKAIDSLKHERDRNYSKASQNELLNYNYNDLSFTLNTYEIYCAKKMSGAQGIEADFDNRGYILNILPSAPGVVPIMPRTPIEKLYFLICGEADNKNAR
jgi:hypothetical protein